MPSPRVALPLALAGTLCAAACAEPPPFCTRTRPVQVVAFTPYYADFSVAPTAAGTLLTVYPRDGAEGYFGRACGEDPLRLPSGLRLAPARVEVDPRDDDPTLACDLASSRFYRIDPTGETTPQLVLPHLQCHDAVPTPRGVLVRGHRSGGAVGLLLLFPDFPDESTARTVSRDFAGRLERRDDDLYYTERSGALQVRDLATGARRRLPGRVADFAVTATHLLWREQVDADVAPMRLRDLATGADRYLGLHHVDADASPRHWQVPAPAWHFDPTGEFVLHYPGPLDQPMTAYDLSGAQVPFPAWGLPLVEDPDGAVLVTLDGGAVVVARPGRADAPPLAVALDPNAFFSPITALGGAVELVLGEGDLYRVPLAGGAPKLLARGVGSQRFWVDERHLVTLDGDELATIHTPTGSRTQLARRVMAMRPTPDGVYYLRYSGAAGRGDGVWFLSATAFIPPPILCHGEEFCD